MFLMGQRVFRNRMDPLRWFLPKGDPPPPLPDLIQSVDVQVDHLSTSPNCSTTDQHSCTDVEESRIVLAILHQTVSYSDCIVLVVVSTNVMRELLI